MSYRKLDNQYHLNTFNVRKSPFEMYNVDNNDLSIQYRRNIFEYATGNNRINNHEGHQ